jgi:hypothetical protein
MFGGREEYLHALVILALDGGEWCSPYIWIMMVTMKCMVIWVVTLYPRSSEQARCSWGTYCLHLQSWRVNEEELFLPLSFCWFLLWLTLQPCRLRWCVPMNLRDFSEDRSVTALNTILFLPWSCLWYSISAVVLMDWYETWCQTHAKESLLQKSYFLNTSTFWWLLLCRVGEVISWIHSHLHPFTQYNNFTISPPPAQNKMLIHYQCITPNGVKTT